MMPKKKVSNTLTMLVIWLASVPFFLFAQAALSLLPAGVPGAGLQLPLSIIVISVGTATCSFLGLEYGNNFISNTQLDPGKGDVTRMKVFKVISYTWLAYLFLVIALQFVSKGPFPQTEIATFSGAVMVAYVSGNKAVKIATTMGPAQSPRSAPYQAPVATPMPQGGQTTHQQEAPAKTALAGQGDGR
jgi:hypothetical protein